MSSPLPQSRLEVEVKDFGPIVHAKLDLRPMTVFIGPSNTGKSYLAVLLYALHQVFGAIGGSPGSLRYGLWRSQIGTTVPEHTEEATAAFAQLARSVSDIIESRDDASTVLELPDGIVEFLRWEFDKLGGNISSEILRCFGLDATEALVRKGSPERALVAIRHHRPNDTDVLEQTLSLDAHGAEFRTSMPRQVHFRTADLEQTYLHLGLLKIEGATPGRIGDEDAWPIGYLESISSLMDLALRQVVGGLASRGFYLPADRTGVMHAHSAIVSAMIDSAPMAGLRPVSRTPLLSGVLADFISQLIRIDQRTDWQGTDRRPKSNLDIGQQIEENILGGVVSVERSELINYPQFTYRPGRWKEGLPLMHASSMVSDLAPVVLYLRHLVQPGNVLIIEEPESHLHPDAQVKLTRQLAKLVQQRYRVIITTHSEWILEELANVVQRSQLPPDELSTVSVSDAALTADQVGVWLFRPKTRPRGSEVVELRLDESGLYPSDFNDVAIALGNDSAKIYNRIGK
ncbi:MAG: AAA family ATPase [Chloroflexota bacterium]|nr:AAA family ATPase [Chloroflexota bacterium]MDE2959230.1 AAA family ATPase [Chloroflexota bacterium]